MSDDDTYDNIPVSLRILGAQLKSLREREALTQAETGDKCGFSESLIRSVERGRRPMKRELAERVESVFRVPGVFTPVVDEQLLEPHPDWFQPFAHMEAECLALSTYAAYAVHGLLQTEAYARAIFEAIRPALSEAEIERRLAARMSRQALISRDPGPELTFVLEESVLRRPFGGPDVLREQLGHILRVGGLRHVVVQVMPTVRGEHASPDGPFTLVEPPDRPMCAYFEIQGSGKLITERRRVNQLVRKYGILQGQALTPIESVEFIEQLANGER